MPKPLNAPNIFNLQVLFKRVTADPHGAGAADTFPFGSKLLVTGPPGAGKSFFALALARELMRANEAAELYLITVEHWPGRLRQRYGAFGWFTDTDSVFLLAGESAPRPAANPPPQRPRVRLVPIDEWQLPKPTRGAEELINPVLARVRRLQTDRRKDDKDRPVLVVVDTVTALVKDSPTAGDRQRNLQELVDQLAEALDGRPWLIILVASAPADQPAAVEEDVASHVFRLRLADAGGRRVRVLDIPKAPESAPVMLGAHTWEVLTPKTLAEVFAFKPLQEHIQDGQAAPAQARGQPTDEPPTNWATLAVIPHARLVPIGLLQEARRDEVSNPTVSEVRLYSGVPMQKLAASRKKAQEFAPFGDLEEARPVRAKRLKSL